MDEKLTELAELKRRREHLNDREHRLEHERGSVQSELVGIDRSMAVVVSEILGVQVSIGSPAGSRGVGRDTLPVPSVHMVPSVPTDEAMAAICIVEESQRAEVRNVVAEERAWEKLLRTPRAKKKWRDVHVVRRAIERLGGRAGVSRILVEVKSEAPSWNIKRLATFLARDEHYAADPQRRWHYVPGGPTMTDKEKQVFKRYHVVAVALASLGGEATFGEILDEAHRHVAPETLPNSMLARYLRSGPFEKREDTCTWVLRPGVEFRNPETPLRKRSAGISRVREDAQFPRNLPVEDWGRRCWGQSQQHSWRMVCAAREVICARGGRATVAAILNGVGAWKRKKGAPMFRSLVTLDPHFVANPDGTISFVDGPPYLTPDKARLWEIREALRSAVIALGGAAGLADIRKHLRTAEPSFEIPTNNLVYALNRGPYVRDQDHRWHYLPERESALPSEGVQVKS